MDEVRSALTLNLSNQVNTYKAERASLMQLNSVIVMGLGELDVDVECQELVPVSVFIDKSGEVTIRGLDGHFVNNQDIQVYSDRKVTTSENEKEGN